MEEGTDRSGVRRPAASRRAVGHFALFANGMIWEENSRPLPAQGRCAASFSCCWPKAQDAGVSGAEPLGVFVCLPCRPREYPPSNATRSRCSRNYGHAPPPSRSASDLHCICAARGIQWEKALRAEGQIRLPRSGVTFSGFPTRLICCGVETNEAHPRFERQAIRPSDHDPPSLMRLCPRRGLRRSKPAAAYHRIRRRKSSCQLRHRSRHQSSKRRGHANNLPGIRGAVARTAVLPPWRVWTYLERRRQLRAFRMVSRAFSAGKHLFSVARAICELEASHECPEDRLSSQDSVVGGSNGGPESVRLVRITPEGEDVEHRVRAALPRSGRSIQQHHGGKRRHPQGHPGRTIRTP